MRKLFAEMRDRLTGFLDQRTALVLAVRAGEAEYLPLVSILNGLEDGESGDQFWIFPEPFESAEKYVAAVVESFRLRYVMIVLAAKKDGLLLPETLPPEVHDSNRPPAQRLRSLLAFARDLIPPPNLEFAKLVVGFVPTDIRNPDAFAFLMMELIAHEMPVPWCHHMRIVVREEAHKAPIHTIAKKQPTIDLYVPDMSQDAVQASLDAEVQDQSLPLPQRMQSLMLLAGMDLAYRRFPAANEKYLLLAKYHKALGPASMYALSLNGLGEIADRTDDKATAQKHYEAAVIPAVQAQDLPSLLIITGNLGNLHRLSGHWQEAFDYYQALFELGKALGNSEVQLRSLEQMGFCKHKSGDPKAAWEKWNEGVAMARQVDSKEHLLDCLERIHGLYKESGSRSSNVEPEINALKRQGVRPYPA